MTRIDSRMPATVNESVCAVGGWERWEQLFGSPVSVVSKPESWGQPSVNRYILVASGKKMHGQLISGVYVSSQPDIPMDDLLSFEPEDVILVTSGILPRLIDQAQREPPSLDWERDLNEL